MGYEQIIYEKEDGVAIITLNRPETLNALTDKMMREIGGVLDEVATDEEVKVVILTGSGRGFCPGGDLVTGELDLFSNIRHFKIKPFGRWTDLVLKIHSFEKPLIAAVNGHAAAGGYSLACLCDFRIASENAKFTCPQTRIGASADGGISYLLPRIVGVAKALELAYTADTIDAQEAYRIGLVSRVVPHEQLLTEVKKLALRIAKGPSVAIELTKKVILAGLRTDDISTALAHEVWAVNVLQNTDDLQEGLAAFREKRPPHFKGR